MAKLTGIGIFPCYNARTVRCGLSGEPIRPSQETILVRVGSHGRYVQPVPLLAAAVGAVRELGQGSIIARALGLEVRLIALPEDAIVLVGKRIVYTEDYTEPGGYNRHFSARQADRRGPGRRGGRARPHRL